MIIGNVGGEGVSLRDGVCVQLPRLFDMMIMDLQNGPKQAE
jgi:hypothetical protein